MYISTAEEKNYTILFIPNKINLEVCTTCLLKNKTTTITIFMQKQKENTFYGEDLLEGCALNLKF